MVIFNRYIDRTDHVWYDSSNVLYSKCYDKDNSDTVTLKVVFKQGRTYVYKDVSKLDYMAFKSASSNGEAFNRFIKKYTCARLTDTDMEQLNELMDNFKENDIKNSEKKVSDLSYKINMIEKTGEFTISVGENILFRGFENNFSIFNLLHSLNLTYSLEYVNELVNNSDENDNKISIND